MEFSLRQQCKKIVENMVKMAVDKAVSGSYLCMVVDQTTLRILSSIVRNSELVNLGVTVVDNIAKHRQPLRQLDVIYFVTPTSDNVEYVLEDFPASKPGLYAGIHIFFAYKLSTVLFQRICKQEHIVQRIRNFVDLHLDFLPKNHRAFHFDHPSLLVDGELEVQSVVRGLASVALTVGQWPTIRYQSDNPFIERVARGLEAALAEWWDKKEPPTTECIFLVVDRSLDLAAPLLHEFTYEALTYDALDGTSINPHEDSFEYVATNARGEQTKKKVLLSDDDALWVRWRHRHILHVNERVTEEVRHFSQGNAMAKMQKQETSVRDPNATSRMIRQLPEYQEKMSRFNYHSDLCMECFRVIEQRKIKVIAQVEQDLATGIDSCGRDVSCLRVMCQLVTIFPDTNLSPEIKVRLLLLYIATMEDIDSSHVETMIDAAQVPEEERQEWIDPFLKRYFHSLEGKQLHKTMVSKKRRDFFKEKSKCLADGYELARFEPLLKSILEELIEGKLDAVAFPTVENRGVKWTARAKGQRKREAAPIILCYVHRGVTYSETRVAFEVSDAYPVDVVVGGNRLLTPRIFLESLREA
eukprot:GEMP01012320.1.p1 GENE.GEMP01012320.1~~GEMP01012320.1.p1  ORF type:complete len:583 (+),score=104.81 GEMP01012320.1:26-1774(+)